MSAYHSERSTWLYLYWDTPGIHSLHNGECPSQWKGPGLSYHQLVAHLSHTRQVTVGISTNTYITSLTTAQSIQNTDRKNIMIQLGATRDS